MKQTIKAALTLATLTGTSVSAQQTEIAEYGSRPATAGSAENFTGAVLVEPIFPANEVNGHNTGLVTFAPGARTAWHTHPRGQLLIITDGAGWVQAAGEEKRSVRAGDAVWFPPNVNHWHGASDTTLMRHIALTYMDDGSNVTWGDLVSDDVFQAETGQ